MSWTIEALLDLERDLDDDVIAKATAVVERVPWRPDEAPDVVPSTLFLIIALALVNPRLLEYLGPKTRALIEEQGLYPLDSRS